MTFGFWKWIRNWIRSWKTKQLSDVVSIHSQPSLLAFLESKSKKTTIKMKMRRIQMNIVDVEPLIRFILRASWANTVAIENDLANEWIQSLKFFRVNGSARSFFGPFCLLREKPILGGQRPASNKCKYKYINEIHILPLAGEANPGRVETSHQKIQIQ